MSRYAQVGRSDISTQGLLTDINPKGRLVERNFDPFLEINETDCQTAEPYPVQKRKGIAGGTSTDSLGFNGKPPMDAHRTLNLAVGLLGLEPHEKPKCWSEVWLTFQDSVGGNCGLGREGLGGRPPSSAAAAMRPGDKHKAGHGGWENRVLHNLRSLVEGSQGQQKAKNTHDWGPDFMEHLDLADFILGRIGHNVGTLEDPEQRERPLLLKAYGEAMVKDVCIDLKQWMEQLATLIGLYHCHLLDLETSRQRLSTELKNSEVEKRVVEKRAQVAEIKVVALEQHWEEDKLKRKAKELLGKTPDGESTEDAPIYSQTDVDMMKKAWERENLPPLHDEIQELKLKIEDLNKKMKEKLGDLNNMRKKSLKQAPTELEESLSAQGVALAVAATKALSEKTYEDSVCKILLRLGEACKAGEDKKPEDKLQEVLFSIGQMPAPTPVDAMASTKSSWKGSPPGTAGGPGSIALSREAAQSGSDCLGAVADQFDKLESRLRRKSSVKPGTLGPLGGSGSPKAESQKFSSGRRNNIAGTLAGIAGLAGWARDAVKLAQETLTTGGLPPMTWAPPPTWNFDDIDMDMDGDGDGEAAKGVSVGVQAKLAPDNPRRTTENDDDDEVIKKKRKSSIHGGSYDDNDVDLEAELENARRAAEEKFAAEREKLNELVVQLEKDLKSARDRIQELTKKILELERLLKAKGLGAELQEAMEQSGLSDYLASCRAVYERLYKDAMDRMRRFAESQARRMQETTQEYIRTVDDLYRSQNHNRADMRIVNAGQKAVQPIKTKLAAERHEPPIVPNVMLTQFAAQSEPANRQGSGVSGVKLNIASPVPGIGATSARAKTPLRQYVEAKDAEAQDAGVLAEQIMAAADKIAKNSHLTIVELQAFLGEGTNAGGRYGAFLSWIMANSGVKYRKFDANGNGQLSLPELREAVSAYLTDAESTACSTARYETDSMSSMHQETCQESHEIVGNGPCLIIKPLRRDTSKDSCRSPPSDESTPQPPSKTASSPQAPGQMRGVAAQRGFSVGDLFPGGSAAPGATTTAAEAWRRGRQAAPSSGVALPPLGGHGASGSPSSPLLVTGNAQARGRSSSSSPPPAGNRTLKSTDSEFLMRIQRLGPPGKSNQLSPSSAGKAAGAGMGQVIGQRLQRNTGSASMPQLGGKQTRFLVNDLSGR